jgi:RNA polymerase sigma factor (sigma-70 family)
MANARSFGLLHQVRTLFGAGVVAGLTDAELLERFTAQSAAADDAAVAAEAAFSALVARHGPMVLGVCRRALADPNDVEDAFQATFLVLVRRARSVRVGDSLGRWLYGVARRVAAKARRARSERSRGRTAPLPVEPVAPEPSADRIGLLAALDEEVSRLPERYRAPVVLCHLEGLTHAEAAARLRWPVGTVSGRLSRARDLLKDRLVRRGLAPTAGSMVALLANEGARAAVPEPLTTTTVRAATRLATGATSQAGAVSASALSLVNAVLRAAVVVKLKVAAVALMVIAVAGASVAAGIGAGAGARHPANDPDTGRAPAVASRAATNPAANHRPADEIVKEIEALIKNAAESQRGDLGDLRLMPAVNQVSDIPTVGRNLTIVADVDHVLHFRIFDRAGKMVVDRDEKKVAGHDLLITGLRQQLADLWPPHQLTQRDKLTVTSIVTSLVNRTPMDEWQQTHGQIAALVGELRAVYPDDPRVGHYLPERWTSLNYIGKRDLVHAEIREVLETTNDPALRKNALFLEGCFRLLEPIDGSTAVSLAESFARQAPEDKRVGELLYGAASRLDSERYSLLGLAAIFMLAAGLLAATIGMRRWLKYAVRAGEVILVLSLVLLCGFVWLTHDRLIATLQFLYEKISDGSAPVMVASWVLTIVGWLPETLGEADKQQRTRFIISGLWNQAFPQIQLLAGTVRTAFALTLAALSAAGLVMARKRSAGSPMRWVSTIRLGILGFLAGLTVACLVDAGWITFQWNGIRERIVRDYPDSFRGRMVQGEHRQHERIGTPFELEFNDAITGRHISMKDLRGKVVVVDFWATWCGPCVGEIPEMKRLYAQYHDQGVEFIGVSHDLLEEEGGLEALKTFVAEQEVPWPQYYQAHDGNRIVSGSPTDDFSEFWGISGIPTVFLIDAEGRLYSTEARGRLETLIPRLLKGARVASSGQ